MRRRLPAGAQRVSQERDSPLPHGDEGREILKICPDRQHDLRDTGPSEPRERHSGMNGKNRNWRFGKIDEEQHP